jgi:hypothetical protein
MSDLRLPYRGRGRLSAAGQTLYDEGVEAWCAGIIQIASSLDFKMSARGWCYFLEQHGVLKGEFDTAERLINDCRKNGRLPLDITAADSTREAEGIEDLDDDGSIADEAEGIVGSIKYRHLSYTPFSFWEDQPYYVEMVVEKIDLKSLFSVVCSEFRVPITNAKGWSDIHSRAAMMRRFSDHEENGNTPVLLYCGDFDPAGLVISGFIRSNLADLEEAVGWDPSNLIITRFGLNRDFIEAQGLSWIDNLETGNGKFPLNDPRHPDHEKDYVQNYLRDVGVRKVEANALVVRPAEGRKLCRDAILQYVDADEPDAYQKRLKTVREELRLAIKTEMENYDDE